jgi:AraC-like DNA-binding protein
VELQRLQIGKAAGRIETFAARDVGLFSSAVSQVFKPVLVSSDRGERFHGRFRSRAVSNVLISEVVANQHHLERTADLIGSSRSNFVMFNLQQAGIGRVHQGGRQATLYPGDIVIYDADIPYSMELDDNFRMVVIMVPREAIHLSSDHVAQLAALRIPGQEGMARMISPLLTQLSKNMDLLSGHGGIRLAQNVLDIVSTALQGHLGTAITDPQQARRVLLLNAIKDYVDERLPDPDLNPGEIAAAVYISTRHLHGTFREEGMTISTWIRQRRLENCRRDLVDPASGNLPISAIAARWGLMNAPNFSRLFMSAYGQAPSTYRLSAGASLSLDPPPTNSPRTGERGSDLMVAMTS